MPAELLLSQTQVCRCLYVSVFLDIKWDYFPAVFGGRRANIALHVSDGFAVSLSAGRTIQKFRLGVQAKRPSTYPFSAELLPSQPVPSLCCFTGLVRPSFRALHLPVLDMMKFWMVLPPAVEFPLSGSPALQLPPPHFVSFASLWRAQSILSTLCRSESPSPLSALAGLSSSGGVYVLPQTLRRYGDE